MISFRLQFNGDAEGVGIQVCEKALIPILVPVSERIKPADKAQFWVGLLATLSGGMAKDMSIAEAEAVLSAVLSIVNKAGKDDAAEASTGALH